MWCSVYFSGAQFTFLGLSLLLMHLVESILRDKKKMFHYLLGGSPEPSAELHRQVPQEPGEQGGQEWRAGCRRDRGPGLQPPGGQPGGGCLRRQQGTIKNDL